MRLSTSYVYLSVLGFHFCRMLACIFLIFLLGFYLGDLQMFFVYSRYSLIDFSYCTYLFLVCLLSIKFVHDFLHWTETFNFHVISLIHFVCLMILKFCLQSPLLPLNHKNVLLHSLWLILFTYYLSYLGLWFIRKPPCM